MLYYQYDWSLLNKYLKYDPAPPLADTIPSLASLHQRVSKIISVRRKEHFRWRKTRRRSIYHVGGYKFSDARTKRAAARWSEQKSTPAKRVRREDSHEVRRHSPGTPLWAQRGTAGLPLLTEAKGHH